MNFADNIALISEDMDKANEFLLRVESAAASLGLHINEGKTKVMTLNMEDRPLESIWGSHRKGG